MPGMSGARGTMPVASTTWSKPARSAACAARTEPDGNPGALELAPVVTQRLGELLLAGDPLREIELAADLVRGVEQRDAVAGLGGRRRARESGRPRADDGDALPPRRAADDQLGLVAGARIDEARRDLALEDLVETCLVAGDARIDLVGAPGGGLDDEIRVGEERSRHRDHVAVAAREHRFGDGRVVDPVGRDQRNPHLALQAPRHPRERRTRHHRRDRRHARLVPADARC